MLRRFVRQRISYGAMAWDLNQPIPRILERARTLGLPASPYVRGLDALDPRTIRRVVFQAWSWAEAGDQLGFASSTVLNWCVKHGVELGTVCHVRPLETPLRGAHPREDTHAAATILVAGARRYIPHGWTRRDVQELMARAAPSVSNRDIAKHLGKNHAIVGSLRLALKLPPFMRIAQEIARLDARASRIRTVVTSSWSWKQAATTLDLGVAHLQRWCRAHGLSIQRSRRPARPYTPINRARIEQIREALESGASRSTVAAQIGVSNQYVCQVAARLGLPSPRKHDQRRQAALTARITRAMQTATSVDEIRRHLGHRVTVNVVSRLVREIDPQWARHAQTRRHARIRAARAELGPRVAAALRQRQISPAQLAHALHISPFAVYGLINAGTTGSAARQALRYLDIPLPEALARTYVRTRVRARARSRARPSS